MNNTGENINTGKIVGVGGPVVDVAFEKGNLPKIKEALYVNVGKERRVMEVSSQGLKLERTAGFVFDYGIFTNLGEDHIGPGEHRDFEEYLECKSRLFKQCRIGIVNCDDPYWEKIVQDHTCILETYGFSQSAKYQAVQTAYEQTGDE